MLYDFCVYLIGEEWIDGASVVIGVSAILALALFAMLIGVVVGKFLEE